MRHFEGDGANETLMLEEIASILLVKFLMQATRRGGTSVADSL